MRVKMEYGFCINPVNPYAQKYSYFRNFGFAV